MQTDYEQQDACRDEVIVPAATRIVVQFRPDIALPFGDAAERNLESCDRVFWKEIAARAGEATLTPVFRSFDSEERIAAVVERARKLDAGYTLSVRAFTHAYEFAVPPHPHLVAELLERLRRWEALIGAYAEPQAPLPGPVTQHSPHTAAFIQPPTLGIDVLQAWTELDGSGVALVDIESGWQSTHPFLPGVTLIPAGTVSTNIDALDHGNAVLGVIAGQGVTESVTGIAPRASLYFAPTEYTQTTGFFRRKVNKPDAALAAVIQFAQANPQALPAGSVVLLEQQVVNAGGMNAPCECKSANFVAIRTLSALGYAVVEPAGNSARNLSGADGMIEGAVDGVSGWSYCPDGTSFLDSKAIMVGAAESAQMGNGHRRYETSNHGARTDCYAWGSGVSSCSYSNSPTTGGLGQSLGETSAAAAIVAGAAALVQAKARARLGAPLAPGQLRRMLRGKSASNINSSACHGTEIYDRNGAAAGPVIGRMPDLRQIFADIDAGNVPPDGA